MSALLATSPILVPLAATVATAMTAKRARLQTLVALVAMAIFLVASVALVAAVIARGAISVPFGNWALPFGIEFWVDATGASLILVTAIMGASTLVYMMSDADPAPREPTVLPLLFGLLTGVGGAFATGDLFNLYVWFEVMLISALGLLCVGGRVRQFDATTKYMVLNVFGTILLLMAIGLVYGVSGQLNYNAIHASAVDWSSSTAAAVLVMLLIACLFKAGAFPVFSWLPASYHTLPTPLLALFAGLLTKVGVYAVLRILGDVIAAPPAWVFEALGWVAVATMVFGVLGAAYHWDIRRILAFHIISQIGYILLAIALGTPEAFAAALFYTIHHILVKANLFLVGGIIARHTGSFDLRRCGGLYLGKPLLAILFLLPALSLIGIPPLSGFWAKFLVLDEAIAQGRVAWTVAALLVGLLTMYSMLKIWMEAFWKPLPQSDSDAVAPPRRTLVYAYLASIGLLVLTLWISLNPQALIEFSRMAVADFGGTR